MKLIMTHKIMSLVNIFNSQSMLPGDVVRHVNDHKPAFIGVVISRTKRTLVEHEPTAQVLWAECSEEHSESL